MNYSKRVVIISVIATLAVPGVIWLGYGLDRDDFSPHHTSFFTFVRIHYNGYMGGFSFRFGQQAPWAHDYPRAEQNFLKILSELTTVETTERSYLVLDLEDPEIMNYPILYVSEPGYWNCTEKEVANVRAYLKRGGFMIFDDFRDEPGEWYAFSSCIQRALPEAALERLTIEHPVFSCFYEIETLDMVPPYRRGRGFPEFWGMSDDNGRLMVVANFNNDLGDYWEWSDAGLTPIQLSNEAYKFGVNYVIYALTH